MKTLLGTWLLDNRISMWADVTNSSSSSTEDGSKKPSVDDLFILERARSLFGKIGCLQCSNRTIGDSETELAQRLRLEVQQLLKSDTRLSEQQIFRILKDRHGSLVIVDTDNPRGNSVFQVLQTTPMLILGTLVVVYGLRCIYRSLGPMTSHQALRTLLTERYVSIDEYPFSHKEFRILDDLILVPTKNSRLGQKQ